MERDISRRELGYTKCWTREVKEDAGTERASQLNTICVQMDVIL